MNIEKPLIIEIERVSNAFRSPKDSVGKTKILDCATTGLSVLDLLHATLPDLGFQINGKVAFCFHMTSLTGNPGFLKRLTSDLDVLVTQLDPKSSNYYAILQQKLQTLGIPYTAITAPKAIQENSKLKIANPLIGKRVQPISPLITIPMNCGYGTSSIELFPLGYTYLVDDQPVKLEATTPKRVVITDKHTKNFECDIVPLDFLLIYSLLCGKREIISEQLHSIARYPSIRKMLLGTIRDTYPTTITDIFSDFLLREFTEKLGEKQKISRRKQRRIVANPERMLAQTWAQEK